MVPEKEFPTCVRVIENAPPSLKRQPFDPVPDHVQVPLQVPVRVAAGVGEGVGEGVGDGVGGVGAGPFEIGPSVNVTSFDGPLDPLAFVARTRT